MPLIFSTKIVTKNKKGTFLRTAVVIIGIVISTMLFFKSLAGYAAYCFCGLIIFILIATLIMQSDASVYDLKEKFIVRANQFQISTIVFPLADISHLKFEFESFKGMRKNSYDIDPDANSAKHYDFHFSGLGNFVSFKYKKQQFKYEFFVENQQHFYQFVNMLEVLYAGHIDFTENNWYGKTFLMQNVNESDYLTLKQKY